MSGINSKGKLMAAIQAMVAGLAKHYAGQTVTLNGAEAKVADVVAELDRYAPQVAAGAAAETTWKQQLAAEDAMVKTVVNPLMSALRSMVVAAYGASSPTLADFGVTPRHPVVRSTAAKAAAAAKAKATRAARGTKGKRQKASIHGGAADSAAAAAAVAAAPRAAGAGAGGKTG